MTRDTKGQANRVNPMGLRKDKGLSQRKVAQALDVTEKTMSEWERGISKPRLPFSKVKLLMELYECSLDELIQAFEQGEQPTNN